jgi:hypothetical protein
MVVAGAVCGVAVDGELGELLPIALLSIGLGGVVLLLFLEVGLSEDRERARAAELERRRRERKPPVSHWWPRGPRWRRRP